MARNQVVHIQDDGAFLSAAEHSLDQENSHEVAELVRMALSDLKPTVAHAVSLVLQRGMTHAEAAKEIGIPLGTLKSHMARGVARLRQALRRR